MVKTMINRGPTETFWFSKSSVKKTSKDIIKDAFGIRICKD